MKIINSGKNSSIPMWYVPAIFGIEIDVEFTICIFLPFPIFFAFIQGLYTQIYLNGALLTAKT